ncbi:MAG: GNAT family N-acetyltransferase [Brevundimonas sp.]|uniref:GNAT family N-acetyltransferase n=1 Tax=Brevundimonas sp. TaxID=1871086 RepID=UPI00391D3B84
MNDSAGGWTARLNPALSALDRSSWDRLSNPAGNPFLSYDFLKACEVSGCASPATGWQPCHLSLHDETEALIGAMPLYLKHHSAGEYVFDFAWAEAYERAGGAYYPKLLGAVPFTPVTGPRLLCAPDAPENTRRSLVEAAVSFASRLQVSSLHVNFATPEDQAVMREAGLIDRAQLQYWWRNPGYDSFDAFLGELSSSRRKSIRRERREACQGLTIQRLSGSDIREAHWDAFFDFYLDTGERKWGEPYFNRTFFSLLGETMADQIVLVMAFEGERAVAGALNLRGGDALFGRYWGTLIERPFLHFELCYYQAMDIAIDERLARVEAGAQGEHKIARGYRPEYTWSAHYIADEALRAPVAERVRQERRLMARTKAMIEREHLPFRSA